MTTPLPSSRVQYVNPDRTPTRALYYYLQGINAELGDLATVTNIASIVSTVSALQTTVTALTSTVTALTSTVSALQSTVTSLTSTVTTLQTNVTALTTTVVNLQTTVTNLTSTVSTLQTTVTNLTTTVNNIGSELNSTVTSGVAKTVTTNQVTDVTSIALTAGTWLCHGNVVFNPSATPSNLTGWIGTSALTNPTSPNLGSKVILNFTIASNVLNSGSNQALPVGMQRIVSAGSTTVYLGVTAVFASGTMQAYGYLQAILIHA